MSWNRVAYDCFVNRTKDYFFAALLNNVLGHYDLIIYRGGVADVLTGFASIEDIDEYLFDKIMRSMV